MSQRSVSPTYALITPIYIGAVVATTRAVGLTSVLFDTCVELAIGAAIDFSIVVPGAGSTVLMNCCGVVTRCAPSGEGRFDVHATIDSFRISDARREATSPQTPQQEI